MADYVDQQFEGETITLDDNSFQNCVFTDCVLEYGGGLSLQMQDCEFTNCTFEFVDAAQATLMVMQAFYSIGGEPQEAVEAIIEEITAGDEYDDEEYEEEEEQ